MNISKFSIITIAIISALTANIANAQNNKTVQRSVYQVNSLDIMYFDDDFDNLNISPSSSYATNDIQSEKSSSAVAANVTKSSTDTNTHRKRREHYLKRKLFERMEREYNDEENDPGVDSEFDILYASFDTNAIHYPKTLSLSSDSAIVMPLLNGKRSNFVNPCANYRISSRFGPRRRRFHYGIDLAASTGTPVYAAFEGIVRVAKRNKSYGNLIVIRHDNGLETYYAHLSKIEVTCGQKVKAGDEIGLVGNTGRSYGSHLHFETRYLGSAMNPEAVVDFQDKKLINDTLYITSDLFRHKNSNAKFARNSSAKKGGKYHTVRKGDTLGAIASRNRTSVKKLCQLNGLRKNSVIRPGQKLRVR
ncbi:MAG: peptidoglycan DD-metalloendopeptidase family protein [Bacteroidales bacterium]|nr:peptidoglycan DD-metalloendopeptidase family protein [Bacteroidales bacterium]